MERTMSSSMHKAIRFVAATVGLSAVADPCSFRRRSLRRTRRKRRKKLRRQPNILETLDYSKIVWPNPPAITRIKYLNYFCCDKYVPEAGKKKSSWMDRMAGGETAEQRMADKPLFALWTPYGMAVDSKGNVLRRRRQGWRGVHLQHRNQRAVDDQARSAGALRRHHRAWRWTIPTGCSSPTPRCTASWSSTRTTRSKARSAKAWSIRAAWRWITRTASSMSPTAALDQVLVYDADKLDADSQDRHGGQRAHADRARTVLRSDQCGGRCGRQSLRQRYLQQPRSRSSTPMATSSANGARPAIVRERSRAQRASRSTWTAMSGSPTRSRTVCSASRPRVSC